MVRLLNQKETGMLLLLLLLSGQLSNGRSLRLSELESMALEALEAFGRLNAILLQLLVLELLLLGEQLLRAEHLVVFVFFMVDLLRELRELQWAAGGLDLLGPLVRWLTIL